MSPCTGGSALVPAASADPAESTSTSATLSCDPEWNSNDEALYVFCDYSGTYRGMGAFFQNPNPEALYAKDSAVDHRTMSARLSWYDNGAKHSRVEDTGGSDGERSRT